MNFLHGNFSKTAQINKKIKITHFQPVYLVLIIWISYNQVHKPCQANFSTYSESNNVSHFYCKTLNACVPLCYNFCKNTKIMGANITAIRYQY